VTTYTYKCKDDECAAQFEAVHSIHELPEFPCPKCGKETRRAITKAPGVAYKIETTRTRNYGRKRG
jgi:putative FmdB family regulatory protein